MRGGLQGELSLGYSSQTVVTELGTRGPGGFGVEMKLFLDHEEVLGKGGASRTLDQAASPFWGHLWAAKGTLVSLVSLYSSPVRTFPGL